MKRDIKNRNDKGVLHGYQEGYCRNALWFKLLYNNGFKIDYCEYYHIGGGKLNKIFYI